MLGAAASTGPNRSTTLAKKYRVTLTEDERTTLTTLITTGTAAARTLTHARILLKADQAAGGPAWTDEAIRDALDVSLSTIARLRERFVEERIDAALHRQSGPRPPQRLLDGAEEAHLLALTCSAPPDGNERWTLRLLADKLVELEYVDHVAHETVRPVLKKTNSSRG
jgi:transposase